MVMAFSWKLLLDRIPTKINLVRRNIFPSDATLNFVLCGDEESTSFLHCDEVFKVWEKKLLA